MPEPIETEGRTETAVLWAATGFDRQGEVTVGSPVEICVRWEQVRMVVQDPIQDTVVIEAMVKVDRVIKERSRMWLGELDDWYGSGSSGQDNGLMEVVGINYIRDAKGRVVAREAMLKRFRNSVT